MPGRPYSGNHTHAGPSPTEPEATTTTNMVVVGILIGLIITLSIILVILLVRPVMDYLRSSLPENHRRKELRYQTVEGWVISKKLRKHDESCTYAMEHFLPTSKSSSNKRADQASPHKIGPSSSYDTAETVLEESLELEWKECPICMEDFKPNEIVSWSPDDQTSCQHFFHHECIKEWLLRSPHCPYCRSTIIPVDDAACGKRVDKETLLAMSKRRAHKSATTFCCIDHGLVTLCKPASISRRGKAEWENVLLSRVDDEELVSRRGGRHEELNEDCSNSNDNGTHSNSSIDLELSSIIISRGAPRAPTVLTQEDVVPPNCLLTDVESGVAPLDGSDDSPPVSFSYVAFTDEQASNTAATESS